MKALNILLIILFSTFCFSQNFRLEENQNWNKYKKVTELNFENNSKTEYFLENGKIKSVKNFVNDSITETLFIKENIKDSINQIYNADNLLEFDGEFNYFYNEKNQLTEKRDFETLFLRKYLYNEIGLIEKEIGTDIKNTYTHIIEYKYDKCSNLIEKKEEESGKSMRGYLLKPSILNFEYEYKNKNCIWTKKFEKINGMKKLLKKRILE